MSLAIILSLRCTPNIALTLDLHPVRNKLFIPVDVEQNGDILPFGHLLVLTVFLIY